MKVLFIRHAEAVARTEFQGPDARRPLTARGRKQARRGYAALAAVMPAPQAVYCSEAARAVETAVLLGEAFGRGKPTVTRLLNPGCGPAEFRRLLEGLPPATRRVALVGHEPDISSLVGALVAEGGLRLQVKKGACVEVNLKPGGAAELCGLIALSRLVR